MESGAACRLSVHLQNTILTSVRSCTQINTKFLFDSNMKHRARLNVTEICIKPRYRREKKKNSVGVHKTTDLEGIRDGEGEI